MAIMRQVLIRTSDGAEFPFDKLLADQPGFEVKTVDIQPRIEKQNRRIAAEAREKIAAEESKLRHKLASANRLLQDATAPVAPQTDAELAEANGSAVGDPDAVPEAAEIKNIAAALYPFSPGWTETKLRKFAKQEYGMTCSQEWVKAELLKNMMAAAEAKARKERQAAPEPATATA